MEMFIYQKIYGVSIKARESILVTGAAGFIANSVVKKLLLLGYHVVGIDNMNDYYDPKLKSFRIEEIKDQNFNFFKLDIEDRSAMSDLFDKYDFKAVINLAARAGVRYSVENPDIYMSTNLNGALNLLREMVKRGIKKYVMASTSSLYAGLEMPFVETLPVNNPISPYAVSKKAAELLSYTYHHLYDVDVSILRYFTVYGPSGRPDMSILRFVKWIHEGSPIKLFGDGTQSRDFTYIDDIAEGTVSALKPLGYEIINLGGGNKPISILQLIAEIELNLNKKAIIDYLPFRKEDMVDTWANIEKADQLLSWQPRVDFKEGIARTIKWYLDNYEFLKEINLE